MYIATYIPPPGSPFYDLSPTACHITEFDTCINELLEQNGDLHIICNGDFNARTANYQIKTEFSQMDGDDYEPFCNVSLFEPTEHPRIQNLMHLVEGCLKRAHVWVRNT